MKVRYPLEVFALAMVVFSQNMREALITGILIMLLTTLGLVLDSIFRNMIPKWSRNACIIILMVSLTYSIFQIVLITVLKLKVETTTYILHVFLGILISKHIIYAEDDMDYSRFLFEGAGAYAILLIISIIREFMATGAIYGFKIAESDYFSYGFSEAVMGFLLAGIGIAILNRIYYKDLNVNAVNTDGLITILPVVLVIQPFIIDSISPTVSMVITIAIVLILYISIRRYLIFSRISREIKNLPVELVSVGIIYMILSMF